MDLSFKGTPHPTLGMELEIQLIDPISGKLVSRAPALLERVQSRNFKPELFQCTIEINSDVCQNLQELEENILDKFHALKAASADMSLDFLFSGTHPFSHWRNQKITENERYLKLLNQIQWPLRRFLIFGLHLHVGMSSGNEAIYVMNHLVPYIPHFIALTASSPFWIGYDTGLASIRTVIFDTLPRAGLPPHLNNWEEYTRQVQSLLTSGSINSYRDIWWDIRPHPGFGTIEIRACDIAPTLDENMAMSAYIYALVVYFKSQYLSRPNSPKISRWILHENKWRAARYGLDAEILVSDSGELQPIRKLIEATLQELEPLAMELNLSDQFNQIEEILRTGPSYVRQKKWVYEEGCNLSQVVKKLSREFENNRIFI